MRPFSSSALCYARRLGCTVATSTEKLPLLASPAAPLPSIFQPLPDTAASCTTTSFPILYTGSADAASPYASYSIRDSSAFEALIQAAVSIQLKNSNLSASNGDASATHTLVQSSRSGAAAGQEATAVTNEQVSMYENYSVQELQILLRLRETALAPLQKCKNEIDGFISRTYLPLLKYGTFFMLAAQFCLYFNWIFFVFDWNLVEPTTYFLGYTGVFSGLVYHYHRCGADNFTWSNLFQYLAQRKAANLYKRSGLDVEQWKRWTADVAQIKAELARYASTPQRRF